MSGRPKLRWCPKCVCGHREDNHCFIQHTECVQCACLKFVRRRRRHLKLIQGGVK